MIKTIPLLPGHCYHIYNRGNPPENLFRDEENYGYFLARYSYYLSAYVDTLAFCMLKNHFHLLIRVKTLEENLRGLRNLVGSKQGEFKPPNISRQFSHFFNSYSKSINKRYDRTGHLFEERFRRKHIDSQEYLLNTIYYIHFNPQKHGFTDDYRGYPHSSYHRYLDKKSSLIQTKMALEWFQGIGGFVDFHNRTLQNDKAVIIEEDED
jgi:REP element-mobilizing transposase RayT